MSPRLDRLLAQTTHLIVVLALALIVWRAATDFGSVTVINGALHLRPYGWLELIAVAIAWTLVVTAGIAAFEGRDRPLRRALRALPMALTALGLIVVIMTAAIAATVFCASVKIEAGLIAGLLVAAAIAGLLPGLALVPAVAVLEDRRGHEAITRAWSLARGDSVGLATVFAVGVLFPVLLTGFTFGLLWTQAGGWVELVLTLAQEVTLIALAALQAMVLASRYRARSQSQAETFRPGEARVSALGSLVALSVIAALPTVVLGVSATSPGFPSVVTRPLRPSIVLAAAWPNDRGPIIVTSDGIRDCLDTTCATTDTTMFARELFGVSGGGVAVGADGSVYQLTQGQLEHCLPRRVCYRTGQAAPWLGFEAAAITISPYNEIVIARAISVRDPAAPGRAVATELSIVRCRDVQCKEPRIITLGRVQTVFDRGRMQVGDSVIAVAAGRFGRPIVAFSPAPGSPFVHFGWCDTVECAVPGVAEDGPTAPAGMPSAAERNAFPLQSTCWKAEGCEKLAWLAQGERGYRATSEFFQRDGLRLDFGQNSPRPSRLVLLDCPDRECASPDQKIPLMELTWEDQTWALAAHQDGRLVVATSTEIILVKP